MAVNRGLYYIIHLTDKALVTALQTGPVLRNMPRNELQNGLLEEWTLGVKDSGQAQVYASPQRAANEWAATIVPVDVARPATGNFITSPWILNVAQKVRMRIDQDWFEVKEGGWFGIGFLFGTTVRYTWRGYWQFDGPNTAVFPGNTAPAAISQLRWLDGFEIPANGEGTAGGEQSAGSYVSREASRHGDGYGMLITEPPNVFRTHSPMEFQTAITPISQWERFYLRLKVPPLVPFEFWYAHNTAGGAQGVVLTILPSGQISVSDVLSTTVRVLKGTTTPITFGDLAEWHKIDVLMVTGAGVGNDLARLHIYANGVSLLNVTGFAATGWASVGTIASTQLGNIASIPGGLTLHVDDWTGADLPGLAANTLGLDWLSGTKIIPLRATGYGPAHNGTMWPAEYQRHWGRPAVDQTAALDQISASPVGGNIELAQDIVRAVQSDPQVIGGGIIGLVIGLYNTVAAGGTNGQLGYSRNADAPVMTNLAQTNVINWDNAAYLPVGLLAPDLVTALLLRYTPGASAHSRTVRVMQGAVATLGVFGKEDLNPGALTTAILPPNHINGLHNHPYPRSPWATARTAPNSPVIITSGTYVGTGTVQTLTFKSPVSWMWVRRVDAVSLHGVTFWPSQQAVNSKGTQPPSPEAQPKATYELIVPDPGGTIDVQETECKLSIVGNELDSNAVGVTYQYTAFQDPGMRFTLAGVLKHNKGAVTQTTPLWKPLFLPTAAFFHRLTAAGTTAQELWFKGPGLPADSLSRLDLTSQATALSFATGVLTSLSNFHPAAGNSGTQETSFCCWRGNDLSGHAGIPAVAQILTYTGDGNATRTIQLVPSGMRPVWAYIQPMNVAGVFRDPSHTGTTSHQIAGADGTLTSLPTTGITGGGIDQITVGIALNGNTIVHQVIVIMGGPTGCNNGWSCNGETAPVPPIPPPDWPGTPEPPDDPNEPGGGPGSPGPGGGGGDPEGEDFTGQCVAASQKVCKVALSHIGISEPLVDIVTDNTPQAELCRLHYVDSVNESLRDFPWDFATRYADLVHVAGSEEINLGVNDDWSYSFRVPTDCLFPRRLVRKEFKREYDPDPPPFRQTSADATGRLLLTNFRDPDSDDTAPAVQLEYTFRPDCAAGEGDALYRLALSWLVASKLAPALARNKVTAADAWGMYLHTTNRAATVNARAQQQTPNQGDAEWIRGRD